MVKNIFLFILLLATVLNTTALTHHTLLKLDIDAGKVGNERILNCSGFGSPLTLLGA